MAYTRMGGAPPVICPACGRNASLALKHISGKKVDGRLLKHTPPSGKGDCCNSEKDLMLLKGKNGEPIEFVQIID